MQRKNLRNLRNLWINISVHLMVPHNGMLSPL